VYRSLKQALFVAFYLNIFAVLQLIQREIDFLSRVVEACPLKKWGRGKLPRAPRRLGAAVILKYKIH